MKKLVPVAVFLLSFSAQAECNKKVDPNKIILFIDTNNSELEIATTEKAACERGERVVVIPKNHKEYVQHTNASIAASKKLDRCRQAQKSDCEAEFSEAYKADSAIQELKEKSKSIPEQTKDVLNEIKKAKGKIQNITISGHDGGGSFGGYKGDFSRHELAEMMGEFQDINEVKSLLLLGCYTGVQKEVIEWKNIFPDVKIIAGYDGSAPLSDKPAGHQYITDVLLKEKKLLANAEQKKLQSFARQNIQGLVQMNSAMYLVCDDGTKSGEFYYGSHSATKAFRPFDIKECENKKPEIEAIIAKAAQYQAGELEIPKDTARGELRTLYNQARHLEHCGEILEVELDLNQIFNLLFNHGVQQNFLNYFKDDLAEAEKIVGNLDLKLFEDQHNKSLSITQKEIDVRNAQLNKLQNDLPTVIADEEKKLSAAKKLVDDMFKDPQYAAVKGIIDPETGKVTMSDDFPGELYGTAQRLVDQVRKYTAQKYEVEQLKVNPTKKIEDLKMQVNYFESHQADKKQKFEELKQVLVDPEKKIWIPTAKNMEGKSRKDLANNLHNMHRLLSQYEVPRKQAAALNWVSSVTSNHLIYFQNPFSWHEYNGRTEAPEYVQRLKDYLVQMDAE